MYRLGGNCIGFAESKTSSVEKGENIPDTVRTVEKYADAIVMRHSLEGSARVAADSVNIPVINAGTGAEEHPTQALLDTYTMRRELAKRRDKEPLINLDGINVALVGDLRYGRTVHSLARAFTLFPSITLFLVSPDSLKMRREVVEDIKDKLNVTETTNLNEILGKVDVVYMTRIQKERFEDKIEYEKIKHAFVLTPNDLKGMREDAILMHPLPRVDEIDYQVDSTKQASYFSQVENGLITRMALLAVTLTKPKNLPFSDVK
jgi:aspartate carbamoyltransferase catalytic subunit